MKIAIASPLYPPDADPTALYVKELAKRLSQKYEVAVVAYARLPEKVAGVKIFSVNKNSPLFFRMASFFAVLFQAVKTAQVIYLINGASAELPAGLVAALKRKKLIIHFADQAAEKRAEKTFWFLKIQNFAKRRALDTIQSQPKNRPEIMPFDEYPTSQFEEYEKSWTTHLQEIEEACQLC